MNEEIERTLKIMQYAEEQEWKNLYKYIIDLQEQLKAYKQAHDKLIMSNPFKENKRLKKTINEAKEILNHVNWDNNPLLEGKKPWEALVKIEKILEKCDEEKTINETI